MKRFLRVALLVALCSCISFGQNSSLAPQGKPQYFNNSGAVLAGGKLYTYAAGTTTPLATYTDSTLGTPNANPVVLDSAGRANIWLSAASYKFVLKTSADVTLWTVDNISATGQLLVADLASVAAGKGDALVGYKATGTGATSRTVHDRLSDLVYSAKDFGAVGDGVTDDYAAIQAAIDAAELTGGVVRIPPGNYVVTNTLTIDSPGVFLEGAGGFYGTSPGQRGTRISMATATTNKDVILITSTSRSVEECGLRDLNIKGNRASGTLGHGVHLQGVTNTLSRITLDRVYVTDAKEHGFYLDSYAAWGNLWHVTMRDVHASYCGGSGILLDSVTQCNITNAFVSHNYGHGFYVTSTPTNYFTSGLQVHRLTSEYADEGDAGGIYAIALEKVLWSEINGIWCEYQSNHILLRSVQGVRLFIESLGQVERNALNGTPTPGGGFHDTGIRFTGTHPGKYNADVQIEAPGWINASANEPIQFSNTTLTGSIDTTASTSVVGVGTAFLSELTVGDKIYVGTELRTVTQIIDDDELTVDLAFTDQANDTSPEKIPTFAGTGLVLGQRADAGGHYAVPFTEGDVENLERYNEFMHFKAPALVMRCAETTVTGMSGASVSATNLIPAGSLVYGVTVRVITAIAGPTGFKVGHAGDTDAWGAAVPVTVGSTSTGADFTATAPAHFASATSVVLTSNAPNFTAGAARIKVWYMTFPAPTGYY